MKRTLFVLSIVTLLLATAACGAAAAATPAPLFQRDGIQSASGGGAAPKMPAVMATAPALENGQRAANDDGNGPAQKRLVIQNADVTIVVKDPAAKMQAISAMAVAMGGHVVSSSMNETYTQDGVKAPEGSIVVRIPEGKLDDALNEIKGDVVEVRSESRLGEDVTNQYVDLESRLKAKRAAETKLMEILDKATTTEDTLATFDKLTQLQSDIEVIVGQMKYFEQSAALSAITVRLLAEKTIQPIKIAGWEPQGEARDALQALVEFFQGFVTFLIWLVILFIPVMAVIITLLALLWRLLRWFWRKVFPKKPVVTE